MCAIKKLSIIIVNYNGQKFIKNCIDSIYKYCKSVDFEVIIVDNNSTDGSQEFIKLNYPQIRLLSEKVNLGFGKANNRGARISKGENILLLNNDTILTQDIEPIFRELEKNRVGVVGIKMLNKHKKYKPSAGKFPKPLDLLKLSNLNYKREEFVLGSFIKKSYEVDWVSGSFMMIKKEVWDSVNGFDEDFFMYVEDVDLCKRISRIGEKIIFLTNMSYIHFVGFSKFREINLIDGYRLYSQKHFNLANAIIAKTSLIVNYVYKKATKNIR